ncbi:MAG: sensor histidine kinase [Rhizobiaceae bacterium]|nr:sensor histidine kinase [Rhizobiaceae bacterium]
MIVRDQDARPHGATFALLVRAVVGRAVLMILLSIMTLPQASAQSAGPAPLVLTGPADAATLGRHFEYTIDPDWQLKIADFTGSTGPQMQPLPGPVPDFGYTPARIWLRVDVVNGTAALNSWRFFLHANFTQQVAIYRIGSDGGVTTLLDLTEDSPFSARPVNYPQMVAPFDLAPGEAATLVVSYYSQGSSRISMSVETPESFAAQGRVVEAKSYAFYGMMLVMIALAMVALIVLRQPVFGAYAAYLSSIFVYVAHADGMAFQYLWPGFPRFNSMASVVAGSGVMVFGALFAITFLQTRRFHPILHRVLVTVVVCVLLVDVALWATDPQLLKRLLVLMISICTLTFLTAGIVAARTRFREVRFYLFAWCASLIPALLLTARYGFGFEPTIITTYDAVRLALIADALMMGLAIFDRYNHMRQTAMEETLAHSQRSLALSQRLALLEESYQQVSANARQREESVKDTVHDLRQPMNALRLSLRQMFSGGSQKAGDVGQLESALGYMERLVAERLTEKPQAGSSLPGGARGEGDLDIVAADKRKSEPGLHEVLRGIADMFAAEAAAKGLRLRLVLAAPDGEVAAYPLMRVTANLVSNAIKYTRQGRIVLALRRHGAGHRVEVHDTGPGLSGDVFAHALERNQRLDRDRDAAEGSGLGLSVVKDIAASNDWSLSSCDARRTGASIRIALPDHRRVARPPAISDAGIRAD